LLERWVKDDLKKQQDNLKKQPQNLTMGAGEFLYYKSCPACRLFGNTLLGSRVSFSDAYPTSDTDWKQFIGMRHGVGISRITGASHPSALFDTEVLEGGAFHCEARFVNFKLYQLRMMLWVLQDIDDGMVTFGMGGSRGNGQMRIKDAEGVRLKYRDYGEKASPIGGGLACPPTRSPFGREATINGLGSIIGFTGIGDRDALLEAMNNDSMPKAAMGG
jgi:CRISPR/Cas system CSM-associated protein Csm3 (group 7 of RAMP superfamily)